MANVDPEIQRMFAVEVVAKLREAGFEAYWAGGCVRDRLLGRTPKDYDVATSALPEQIRDLFTRRRTLALGAAFGVITVLGPQRAGQIEVATFRQDAAYSDGRHPDAVSFSTPEADAQRRDFTINGLFYDPQAQAVIDFVGGQQDLARGVVRAIGDARTRFAEDKLRLLRAVRFAAAFGFEFEPLTEQAIQQMAAEIHVVSAERIAAELRLILTHGNRRRGVELLANLGLLAAILPEVAALRPLHGSEAAGSDWLDTLRMLESLESPGFPLALVALVHRAGTPALVEAIGERLKLAGAEIRRAAWLLANLHSIEQARELRWPTLQRLLIAEGAGELIALAAARAAATGRHQADLDYCRKILHLPASELNPAPLITGDDLIAHGVPPGPEYHMLLERVRDEQLEKRVGSKAAALAMIDKLRAARPDT